MTGSAFEVAQPLSPAPTVTVQRDISLISFDQIE
jgi:hypothetical protein